MRRAAEIGWIKPTRRMVPSTVAGQHRRPVRVWKSLLAEGPDGIGTYR